MELIRKGGIECWERVGSGLGVICSANIEMGYVENRIDREEEMRGIDRVRGEKRKNGVRIDR